MARYGLLFMFDPRRQVILLLGGDKSGQWNDCYDWAVRLLLTCMTTSTN